MEKRIVSNEIEVRCLSTDLRIEQRDAEPASRMITGYAAKFDTWSEPIFGWFREKIARGAFDDCDLQDVIMCFNHRDDAILGRTTSGTKFESPALLSITRSSRQAVVPRPAPPPPSPPLCLRHHPRLCASASIPTSVLPSASVSRTSATIPASVPPSAFRLCIVVAIRPLRRGKRGRAVPDKNRCRRNFVEKSCAAGLESRE